MRSDYKENKKTLLRQQEVITHKMRMSYTKINNSLEAECGNEI